MRIFLGPAYEYGSKETLVDNWCEAENPKERSSQRFVGKTAFKLKQRFVGKTAFKLKSTPTGRRLLGKRSTFDEPQPLQEPETMGPQEPPKLKLSKEVSVEDTVRQRLAQAASGATLP